MTQEQKAKAYDEALEKAKIEINTKGIGETVDLCEQLFPQLTESEDERIRKELLEEIEFIIPHDDETDSEGLILPSYHARIDRYKSYLEKQKEQKPIEWSEDFEQNIRILLHDKLTWHSEDGSMSSTVLIDDKTLKDIVTGIWFYAGKEASKYPNKELKVEQKPAEWSEEDEEMMTDIIESLEYAYPNDNEFRIAWLKSLRPQPHWKPSKEQMKALLSKLPVVKGGGDKVQDILESLYNDLKKL